MATTNTKTYTHLDRYEDGKAHIERLASHNVTLIETETHEPISLDFFHKVLGWLEEDKAANAYTYAIDLGLGLEEEFWVCIWKDGHVDSGSMQGIIDLLASK